jgi:hypothetical protein
VNLVGSYACGQHCRIGYTESVDGCVPIARLELPTYLRIEIDANYTHVRADADAIEQIVARLEEQMSLEPQRLQLTAVRPGQVWLHLEIRAPHGREQPSQQAINILMEAFILSKLDIGYRVLNVVLPDGAGNQFNSQKPFVAEKMDADIAFAQTSETSDEWYSVFEELFENMVLFYTLIGVSAALLLLIGGFVGRYIYRKKRYQAATAVQYINATDHQLDDVRTDSANSSPMQNDEVASALHGQLADIGERPVLPRHMNKHKSSRSDETLPIELTISQTMATTMSTSKWAPYINDGSYTSLSDIIGTSMIGLEPTAADSTSRIRTANADGRPDRLRPKSTRGSIRMSAHRECGHLNPLDRLVAAAGDWVIDVNKVAYIRSVGRGTFGEVVQAEWDGSPVAIKLLRGLEGVLAGSAIDDFMEEAKVLKSLGHNNIVRFLGVLRADPDAGLVMEYVPRGNLFHLIHDPDQHKLFNWSFLHKILLTASYGMRYLHESGIVHRDLKSANLLVTEDFAIKISDFGLSRTKRGTTVINSMHIAGSPGWMAPEVMKDMRVDFKCDVYSFGVIMWELLTHQIPWDSLSLVQVYHHVVVKKHRPSITADDPKYRAVPTGFFELLAMCWHDDPLGRPSFSLIIEQLNAMRSTDL